MRLVQTQKDRWKEKHFGEPQGVRNKPRFESYVFEILCPIWNILRLVFSSRARTCFFKLWFKFKGWNKISSLRIQFQRLKHCFFHVLGPTVFRRFVSKKSRTVTRNSWKLNLFFANCRPWVIHLFDQKSFFCNFCVVAKEIPDSYTKFENWICFLPSADLLRSFVFWSFCLGPERAFSNSD